MHIFKNLVIKSQFVMRNVLSFFNNIADSADVGLTLFALNRV